jgi:hypothetical protein
MVSTGWAFPCQDRRIMQSPVRDSEVSVLRSLGGNELVAPIFDTDIIGANGYVLAPEWKVTSKRGRGGFVGEQDF